MNEIKFPIAKHKHTGELIDIKDAKKGAECDCICYECKEGLIAINKEGNKQRAHFRHHPGSKCGANFESYIHWLAKEVICSSNTFTIPEIPSKMVLENSGSEFEEEIKKLFKKHNVPEPFRKSYKYKFTLQKSKTIQIDFSEPEVTFHSAIGLIEVDVKIECQGQNLLIEPFFTNPIDERKRKKIINIDETVIDIDLQSFGPAMGYNFTLENFRSNVVHGKGLKSWVYIKRKKIKSLQKILLKRIEEQLKNSEEFFTEFKTLDQKISDEENKLNPIKEEIRSLEKKLFQARTIIGEGFKVVQDIKNEKLKFANSYMPDENLKSYSDPWQLRPFDD